MKFGTIIIINICHIWFSRCLFCLLMRLVQMRIVCTTSYSRQKP